MKSYLKILSKKEIRYWKRFGEIWNRIHTVPGKIVSFPILVATITPFHYAFAGMSTLFETYLYIFNREQYNENIKKMA